MRKILTLILAIIILTACEGYTAKSATERYLKQYKSLDSEVLVDLENVINKDNLSKEQEDKYRDILKKQYKDLSYEIVKEEKDGDVSYITTKVTVYDLHKAQNDAAYYLENNRNKFYTDGAYDEEKYIDYKLDKMKDTTDRITYTIVFTVNKEDDKYVVMQPTENDLMKIHGIYNYDLD